MVAQRFVSQLEHRASHNSTTTLLLSLTRTNGFICFDFGPTVPPWSTESNTQQQPRKRYAEGGAHECNTAN